MDWSPVDPIEHERRIKEIRRVYEVFYITADWDFLDRFFAPNITVEELLQRYAAGERNFVDISLPDVVDLSGVNLSGANFMGAKFSGSGNSIINLSRANLSGINLSYAWLNGANLREVDLSRANLSYGILSGTDLTGANLSGANLSNADVVGATLVDVIYGESIGRFGMANQAFFGRTVKHPDGSIAIEGEIYIG